MAATAPITLVLNYSTGQLLTLFRVHGLAYEAVKVVGQEVILVDAGGPASGYINDGRYAGNVLTGQSVFQSPF